MPSKRSRSLLLHTGGGRNWCTLGATDTRGARRDARSSLRTSGTFFVFLTLPPPPSASRSPSDEEAETEEEEESHVAF